MILEYLTVPESNEMYKEWWACQKFMGACLSGFPRAKTEISEYQIKTRSMDYNILN